MARAIDADRLKQAIDHDYYEHYTKYHDSDQTALIDMVMDDIDEMPTLTPPNEWVSVEERLPELPEKDWCSKMVISCDKNGHVAPMIWERAQVRGKMIERWKYHWDRIYDGAGITHWMPLPAPPGEGNNVPNEPPNKPLTLEELREMDGEPVYIIAKDMGIAEWNVITGKEPIAIAYDCPMPGFKSVVEGIAFANGRAFRAGAYGITWLAYRRPPEGEANA